MIHGLPHPAEVSIQIEPLLTICESLLKYVDPPVGAALAGK
jgi:hypothetical protein